MNPELLHRVRWGNVARAAAVLLALALVLLWPRLRSHAAPLPAAAATPALSDRVATTEVPAAEEPAPARPTPRHAVKKAMPKAARHRRPRRPPAPRPVKRAVAGAPARARAATPRVAYVPPPPPGAEFRP